MSLMESRDSSLCLAVPYSLEAEVTGQSWWETGRQNDGGASVRRLKALVA